MEIIDMDVVEGMTDEAGDWRACVDAVAGILTGPKDTETIVFHWSRNNGDCYGCGLPAAFYLPMAYVRADGNGEPEGPERHNLRCAVCAANAAAEGNEVMRIVEED